MGFWLIGAHLMGFTFVTGCLPCLRLLPTPPHGNAVTGHSPLNDVIGGDVVFIRGLWFSGARSKPAQFLMALRWLVFFPYRGNGGQELSSIHLVGGAFEWRDGRDSNPPALWLSPRGFCVNTSTGGSSVALSCPTFDQFAAGPSSIIIFPWHAAACWIRRT